MIIFCFFSCFERFLGMFVYYFVFLLALKAKMLLYFVFVCFSSFFQNICGFDFLAV